MPASLSQIVKRLANEGLKTLDFFRALEPEDWQQQVYSTGSNWTPREILCHLLDAEQGFQYLISDIRLGGPGLPAEMDVVSHNEQHVQAMQHMEPAALIAAFSQARVTTLEIVRSMSPADLALTGRHPFLGIATIEDIIKLLYRHNMIHQRDIRRAIAAGAPVDAEDDHLHAPTGV